jgi:hypothetical protein
MLGEDNKNEKSHLNLFGMREHTSTARAVESLRYCRHPVFKVRSLKEDQRITATEYLSGKELPLMLPMPRKSVSGVTVTTMAQFGRNVSFANELQTLGEKSIEIGKISHMNRI